MAHSLSREEVDDGLRRPPALPAQVRAPLVVAAVLSAVALVVLGVRYAGDSVGTSFDLWVRSTVLPPHAPWRQLAMVIDFTAEPVGSVLVFTGLVLGFARLGHRRAAVLVVVGTGVSVAMTTALKPVVGRTVNDGFLAFPSGHTATATSIALVAMLVLVQRRRLRATVGMLVLAGVTVLAAVAMAWAQVMENSHYATDTVGGFCTALAVLPPTAWIVDRVADRWLRRSGGTPA